VANVRPEPHRYAPGLGQPPAPPLPPCGPNRIGTPRVPGSQPRHHYHVAGIGNRRAASVIDWRGEQ